jgi:ferredoxin-type protein NapG
MSQPAPNTTKKSGSIIRKFVQRLTAVPKSRSQRRQALKYGLFTTVLWALSVVRWQPAVAALRFLRPPGALEPEEFQKKCIRCGLCGEVCPNQCISFFDLGSGPNAGTPHIVPRRQGCMLCMKCNHVCPSGALQPIGEDLPSIREHVRMGVATLDTNLCYSYNNRICGICYRACPLQGEALKIGPWERPILDQSKCIGCGLCERICYHYPQAIRIHPHSDQQNV